MSMQSDRRGGVCPGGAPVLQSIILTQSQTRSRLIVQLNHTLLTLVMFSQLSAAVVHHKANYSVAYAICSVV